MRSRRGTRRTGTVAALVAAPFLLASCFSDRPEPLEPAGMVPDVECSVAIPQPGPGEAVIAVRDFAFHPAELDVPEGTRVMWINCEDATTHTTTADGGDWNSGGLSPGETFSFTFDDAGTFPYHCMPHPFMTGKVVVEP